MLLGNDAHRSDIYPKLKPVGWFCVIQDAVKDGCGRSDSFSGSEAAVQQPRWSNVSVGALAVVLQLSLDLSRALCGKQMLSRVLPFIGA